MALSNKDDSYWSSGPTNNKSVSIDINLSKPVQNPSFSNPSVREITRFLFKLCSYTFHFPSTDAIPKEWEVYAKASSSDQWILLDKVENNNDDSTYLTTSVTHFLPCDCFKFVFNGTSTKENQIISLTNISLSGSLYYN